MGLRALITGAGSGIGRGIALALGARGHSLVLTDVSAEAVEETKRLLPAGAEAGVHALDVASGEQVGRVFAAVGGVDVLINNAGLQFVSPVAEFPEEKWDLLLDVMLKGPFLMTRAALPSMRAKGLGRIINIGSIHSVVASPFKSAYIAAKHGLLGFSRTVALEVGRDDITINTICPAYIRTPLVDKQIAAQAKSHGMTEEEVIEKIMLEPMPKKAFVTVEEIAGTVEFLISPAARNITGQAIVIDGGWTAK
jgi:3-hydroxybutyrate dehydrogenase